MKKIYLLILAMLVSLLSIVGMGSTASADTEVNGRPNPSGVIYNPRMVPCHTGGYGIQALYVYNSDVGNDFSSKAADIRLAMRQANGMLYDQSGSTRQYKFVTSTDCNLSVQVVGATGAKLSSGLSPSDYRNMGFAARDRVYLVFLDNPRMTGVCGITPIDSIGSPGQQTIRGPWKSRYNPDNSGPVWPSVMPDDTSECQNGETVAHEIFHAIGAVSPQAPHYDGTGHSNEWNDLMDSNDTLIYPFPCDTPDTQPLPIDCNKNDYFNVNPPTGNYLKTNWNTADSAFLWGGGPTDTINQAPWSAPSNLTISAAGAGCPSFSHSVLVGWTAPPTPPGGELAGYRVDLLDNNTSVLVDRKYVLHNATLSVSFLNPGRGKTYKAKVYAVNSLGSEVAESTTVFIPTGC